MCQPEPQRQEENPISLDMIVSSHHGYCPWVLRASTGDGKNRPSFMPATISWWGCLDSVEKESEVNSPHTERCNQLIRPGIGSGQGK